MRNAAGRAAPATTGSGSVRAMASSELDFTGAPVVMFRNAGNGGVNVVYRRNDGNIGWIDPSLSEITG